MRPVLVEAFRKLAGTVEIIGLGGVRQPRGQAQEAEIAVVVACDVERSGAGAESVVRILWLGCGQLDMLVPGSRWRGGRHVGFGPETSMTAAVEFYRNEPIGEGAPQRGGRRPFPSRAIATAPGFLLKRRFDRGAGDDKDPSGSDAQLVLLPKMELLRAVFGVSSGILLELFDGIRNPAVSRERGLIDRRQSRLLPDGTVRLVASRALTR